MPRKFTIRLGLLIGLALACLATPSPAQDDQAKSETKLPLVAVGTNRNKVLAESSGLAISSFVDDAVWTLNDSGNSAELMLLKLSGKLLARVELLGAKNSDWEAMSGFELDGKRYLLAADVGDNSGRRSKCKLYFVREIDLSQKLKLPLGDSGEKPILPIREKMESLGVEFTYEDGAKDCEAVGVDISSKQVFLIEKIFYNSSKQGLPGIYALPLPIEKQAEPLVARRVGEFPFRSVTGMAFSPNGKHLIVRNYLNAHLFSRQEGETWLDVFSRTLPTTVVLPLQRQGEAICFTPDSNSAIVTSEKTGQAIWQVDLSSYLKQPRRLKKKTKSD